jgi:hypothetical protein
MDSKTAMALARRIARHEAPGFKRKVDKKLLAKSASRLQRCPDVVRDLPCSDKVN